MTKQPDSHYVCVVVRGGSWAPTNTDCRSAFRHWHRPNLRLANLGLRPVAFVAGRGRGLKRHE